MSVGKYLAFDINTSFSTRMDTEYWTTSISGTSFPKPMPSTPHDDNLRFMNIILTVAVPQTIPSLEESYKVIASPRP
jgi:hypothetical protein